MSSPIHNASRRLLPPVLALVLAAPALGQGTDTILKNEPPTVMDFSFNSITFQNDGLPTQALCFMMIENPQKRRPLFISGVARRDRLRLTFDNQGGILSDYGVKVEGIPVVEYKDYNYTSGTDAADTAATDWLRQSPPPRIKVSLKSFAGWKETTKTMNRLLNPPAVAADPNKPAPSIEARYDVKVDLEIGVGTQTFPLTGQPCSLLFTRVVIPQKTGDPKLYWKTVFTIRTTVPGKDLGLTGADAGPMNLVLVGGSHSHVLKRDLAPGQAQTPANKTLQMKQPAGAKPPPTSDNLDSKMTIE